MTQEVGAGTTTESDQQEIVRLLATRGWDEGFRFDLGTIYVARDPELIAVLVAIEFGQHDVVLDNMLVKEKRRRQGVGTRLVSAALKNNVGNVYVACREDSVDFYRSLGFEMLMGGIEATPEPAREYWQIVGNRAPLVMRLVRRR